MTKVVFYKNKNGNIFGFKATGHASDMEKGIDIYCAAISAITQTACIGLNDVVKAKLDLKINDGFLSAYVSQKDAENENCQVIFKTLNLGLQSFDESNPGYIQISEEVQ